MGRARGFLEIRRSKAEARPVAERVHDWRELDLSPAEPALREQAARCMDCGVPFCMGGVAPEVVLPQGHWRWRRLHEPPCGPSRAGPPQPPLLTPVGR